MGRNFSVTKLEDIAAYSANFTRLARRAMRFRVHGAQQALGIGGGGIFGNQILGNFRRQAARERRDCCGAAARACDQVFDFANIGCNLMHLVNAYENYNVPDNSENAVNEGSGKIHGRAPFFIDPVRKNTTHQSFKKAIGIAE